MENKILDTPFNDSFNDLLEKGETIIWTGQPLRNYSLDRFETIVLVTLLFLTFISWATTFENFKFIGAVTVFFAWLIFYAKGKEIKEGKNTFYALSQKRIFYEFKNKDTSKVFFIPIKNIKKVSTTRDVIYIETKKTELMPFDIFDYQKPIRRHQHLLKGLDEIELVAQLIENKMKSD